MRQITKHILSFKTMKHLLFISLLWSITLSVNAQVHVKQVIDKITKGHPDWVNYSEKKETGNAGAAKSGTSSRIYHLTVEQSVIDNLIEAFDSDKMDGYSYIRTSAAYNQTLKKSDKKAVFLQNGEKLEIYSVAYSFITLSVINPNNPKYRTNYILKYFTPLGSKINATLYILSGPRPNNQ